MSPLTPPFAAELEGLILTVDKHDSPTEGMCVIEAVSYFSGEGGFTDHPASVSNVIAAMLREWNDGLGDVERQQLKRYVLRLSGTAASATVEERRAFMALDWLVRTMAPGLLRLARLGQVADTLEWLPGLEPGADLSRLLPWLDDAAIGAQEAVDVDQVAASATALAAAAESMSRYPIGATAQAAVAGAAEIGNERLTFAAKVAGSIVADASVAACIETAVDAVAQVVDVRAMAAGGIILPEEARTAAWLLLRPLVLDLHDSAHLLVERMIAVESRPTVIDCI